MCRMLRNSTWAVTKTASSRTWLHLHDNIMWGRTMSIRNVGQLEVANSSVLGNSPREIALTQSFSDMMDVASYGQHGGSCVLYITVGMITYREKNILSI